MKHFSYLFFLIFLWMGAQVSAQYPTPQHYNSLTSSGGNSIPFSNNTNGYRGQFLFPSGVFGVTQPGLIHKLYFYVNSGSIGSTVTYSTMNIQLKQENLTALNSGSWVTGMTNVLTANNVTYGPTAIGEWFEVPLTVPFMYDPNMPLIVDIESVMSTYSLWYVGTVPSSGYWRAYATPHTSGAPSSNGAYGYMLGFDLIAQLGPNNAGISELPSVSAGFCPGVLPITAKITNYGNNILDSVYVDWTVNGNTQPGNWFEVNLDTIGSGNNDTIVQLGTFAFLPGIPYTVKAWTSLPNNMQDTVNINDTTTVTAQASLSGNYTINSALPTGGSNFQTFNDLSGTLNTYGICGPMVIDVVPGSGPYNEQVQFGEISGSSPVNTITLRGHNNTLTYSPIAGARYVMHFNGTDYFKVDSLNIVGTNATYGYGVAYTGDATYDTLANCTIDISAVTSTTAANSTGLLINGTITSNGNTGLAARNCYFANNLITGGQGGGPYYGIRVYGTSGSVTNNQFINNRVLDYYAYGVQATNVDSSLFKGNEFARPNKISITTYYGLQLGSSCRWNIVDGNRMHTPTSPLSSAVAAYPLYVSAATNSSTANILSNNIIYNLNNVTTIYSVYLTSAAGTKVYHNTLSLDDVNYSSTSTTYGIYQTSSVSDIEIRNNIFTIGRGGAGTKYALYYSGNGVSISNNNVINITSVSGNNNVGYAGGSAYSDLQSWQAGTSFDANSMQVDPMYISPGTGDFRPINAVIDNIGANLLSVVPTDILGVTRTATPDPGAIEFSIPPDDAGISALISPDGNFCPGNNNVIIRLTNFGTDVLNLVTVSWTVNGTPQTPLNLSGMNLAQGADTIITVGSYNYISGQTYDVTVYTSNPNGVPDLATYNDTVHALNLSEGMAGNYTIDPNLPPSATNYQSFNDAAADLNTKGICNSVIFDVAAGTYNESVTLGQLSGTSSTSTVTFRSANSDSTSVIIAHSSNALTNGTINLTGADWVHFSRLTFLNSGSSFNVNVYMTDGSHYNRFSNCVFLGDSTNTSSTSNNLSHIYSGSSRDEFNTFENNRFKGNAYGFNMSGVSANEAEKGNLIRNNFFDGQSFNPIRVLAQDSVVITDNTIDMISTTSSNTYGIYLGSSINGCNISGNVVIPSASYPYFPVYFTGVNGGTINRTLVSNNMIANGDTIVNDALYGMYFTGSGNIDVVHNSIHLLTNSDNAIGIYAGAAGEINLLNNIVSMARRGRTFFFANSYNVNSSDHNLLYTNSAVLGAYNGFNFPNLVAWQNHSGLDLHSVDVNPAFTSDTVLRTCNAAVNGGGTPLANVSTDIDGDSRNLFTPDIGADEFTGAGLYNLGPDIFKCAQDTVSFGGEDISGNTYQWNTLQTTPEITTNQAGAYIITVTSSCGIATDTIVVNNIPLPSATFTSVISFYTASFTYTGSGATSWHWDFGDGGTDTLQNPYHIYANNGSYIVTLTTYNDCGDSAVIQNQVIINVPNLGTEEVPGKDLSVIIYPNPSDGHIQFAYSNTVNASVYLAVFDQSGRQVHSYAYPSGVVSPEDVDLSGLPPGSYIMRLQAGEIYSYHKLLIVR